MALSSIIISIAAIIVASSQAYWAWRLVKGRRELAEMRRYNATRAQQQAPELIIEAEGSIPPEAVAMIRERAAAIKRDPRATLGGH